MLYSPSLTEPQVRHRCRNPRCGTKLKIPAANPDAFCCRGCEAQFYSRRCRVCEALFSPKTGRRQTCGRSRCRHEFQRHPELFLSSGYATPGLGHNALRNPIKPGLKIGTKTGRPFRIVAGPAVPEINLRIAPEVSILVSKANRARFQRHTPPVNIIGGFRFPGAPKIDLAPIGAIKAATITEAATIAGPMPAVGGRR